MKALKVIISVITAVTIIAGTIAFAFGSEPVTGSAVAAFARGYEGYDYQYACKGPKKFDCSGFVYFVLDNFGITFGNSTAEYNTKEEAKAFGTVMESIDDAKEGDIVIWNSHVAVYLGNGECISAMNPKIGVCIRKVADFVDKDGVKNPSHFFVRPFEYTEEPVETDETQIQGETEKTESRHMTLKERVEDFCERVKEFFQKIFMPFELLSERGQKLKEKIKNEACADFDFFRTSLFADL